MRNTLVRIPPPLFNHLMLLTALNPPALMRVDEDTLVYEHRTSNNVHITYRIVAEKRIRQGDKRTKESA